MGAVGAHRSVPDILAVPQQNMATGAEGRDDGCGYSRRGDADDSDVNTAIQMIAHAAHGLSYGTVETEHPCGGVFKERIRFRSEPYRWSD